MSIHTWKRRLVDAPAGWQPIGLPDATPAALVRRETTPALRKTVRHLAGPAAALTASVAVLSVATIAPSAQGATPGSSTLAASSDPQTPIGAQTISAPADNGTGMSGTATTTTPTGTGSASTGASSSSGSPLSSLPTSNLPTGGLPVVGGFVNHAPEIFTGGLFGGQTVQTSTDPNQSGGAHSTGDTTHEGGGDACDFFLQHMWKNEDGIPLLGSSSHVLTYHTDPSYKNLILSTASGAIGNSQMPVIDIYGGPLGWIPIFNPSHVRGHGTDYVTLLTGCGGMGLPINTKNMSLDLNKIPTPEKVTAFATRVMPDVPNLSKVLGPDYLYNTLQTKEVMSRLGPSTVFTPDEYLAFAGKNFDVFRMLWQTALQQVTSGNPTGVLDVLKVTNNIQTLQSLGLPGLPGSSGPTLTSGVLGGSTPSTPGSTTPGSTTPGSTTPGSTTPGSTTPGSSTPGSSTPGSDPLSSVTSTLSSLTGGLSLPGSKSPSSDQPSGSQPGSSQPSSGQPSSDQPSSGTPSSDQPSSNPLSGVLGSLGGGLPGLPGASTPSGDQPSSTQPSSDQPGSSQPGSDQPSSGQPSSEQPSSGTPSSDQPSSNPLSGVLGSLGGGLPGLPGASTPSGDQPSSTQPSSTQPSSDQPSSGQPSSDQPSSGTPSSDQPSSDQPSADQPSSDPVSTVTKTVTSLLSKVPGTSATGGSGSDPVSGVLGGSLPLPGASGSTSDQPSSSQPSADQPSADQPSSSQPSSSQPSSQQPADGPTNPAPSSGDQPAQPSQPSSQQDTLSFQAGGPTVNGTPSGRAPGATVTPGSEITVSVPVTNNGSAPITDVKAQVPGAGGLTDMQCSDAAIEPGQSATCSVKLPAQNGNVKMGINIIATSDDGQQMTKLCRIYYHAQQQAPQVGFTGKASLNGQSIQAAGQSPLSSSQPSSLSFQVVNKGNAPMTSLSGSSPMGNVTCGSQSLAPGQTTSCTVAFTPKAGSNAMNIQVTGQDAAGHASSSSFGFTYTANTGSALSGVAPSN